MFKITKEEIDTLIADHKGQKTDKMPKYKLKDLIKYGMMYVYGVEHYRTGRVIPCDRPFSLFEPHGCRKLSVAEPTTHSDTLNAFEVKGLTHLAATHGRMLHCWAGYNLAIVTNGGELRAYFKRDLLFKKYIPSSSAIAASADKIYVGTKRGELINFDPITQTYTTKCVHTADVTSLELVDGIPLSASVDGTIFYKKSIRINDCGISIARAWTPTKIVCASNDRQIIIVEGVGTQRFAGHTSPITDLSCRNGLCVSSSSNGAFGFIGSSTSMSIFQVGSSKHRFVNDTSLLCYGLDSVKLFDIEKRSSVNIVSDPRNSTADVRENLIAYAVGSNVYLRDIRGTETARVALDEDVLNVSFSNSGYLLLITTHASTHLLNIRAV